jgi:Protein of unknown function (DUF4058)
MPIHDWTRVDAGIFHHFHHRWISAISDLLNAGRLPADYYALAEQIAGGLHPDVLTLGQGQNDAPDNDNGAVAPESPGSGIALATAPPRVRFTDVAELERYAQKRSRIAIHHVSGDRVVALVELVSPGNKASRHALRSFVDKAVEFLEAGIHLLFVDLFPPGSRDPQGIHAVLWSEIKENNFQLPSDKPLTLAAYSAGTTTRAFVEPAAVGDVLTDMPLFLEPELYVPVPLEATYNAAFDAVPRRWRDVLTAQ